jgi:hypothetical protein
VVFYSWWGTVAFSWWARLLAEQDGRILYRTDPTKLDRRLSELAIKYEVEALSVKSKIQSSDVLRVQSEVSCSVAWIRYTIGWEEVSRRSGCVGTAGLCATSGHCWISIRVAQYVVRVAHVQYG